MATSPEVLASLNEDLALEHGAIIQYVIHGIQLRDAAITDPVRRIAREEMWHFEWLYEAIQDRGGTPALDRAEVFLFASLAESMTKDVVTEEMALEHYARTLELIGDSDPKLTLLIERIVDDEHHHRTAFDRLSARVAEQGDAAFAAHPLMSPEDLPVAGATIGFEYGNVLQYLVNKYGSGDCEAGERYFEFAIDTMRHLSSAGAYLPGIVAAPVPPAVPIDRVQLVDSPDAAHAAAQALEAQATGFFAARLAEVKSELLAEDLTRAAGQHEWHRRKLEQPE